MFDALGGPAGDRGWAVVNPGGDVTWQGEHPRLALVRPTLSATHLHLVSPGLPSLSLPLDQPLGTTAITIWNERTATADRFTAQEAGDEVADWLLHATGAPLRLVKLNDTARSRNTVNRVHVVSETSLQAVDQWLADDGHAPADVRRYRPNVVLAGPLPAFEEDYWTALQGHHVRLDVTGPCVRCIVPNVDPRDATVSPAPLQAMTDLSARRRPGQPVSFGLYGRATPGGRLHTGDTLAAVLDF